MVNAQCLLIVSECANPSAPQEITGSVSQRDSVPLAHANGVRRQQEDRWWTNPTEQREGVVRPQREATACDGRLIVGSTRREVVAVLA